MRTLVGVIRQGGWVGLPLPGDGELGSHTPDAGAVVGVGDSVQDLLDGPDTRVVGDQSGWDLQQVPLIQSVSLIPGCLCHQRLDGGDLQDGNVQQAGDSSSGLRHRPR